MGVDQVELNLGRYDREPALFLVEPEHVLQHEARRGLHRRPVAMGAVEEHRRRRIRRPGHRPNGVCVGAQDHVPVLDVVLVLRVVARDGLGEDAFGQLQLPGAELRGRQYLAAGRARHIGHEGLDVFNRMLFEPRLDLFLVTHVTPVFCDACSLQASPKDLNMASENGFAVTFHSGCHWTASE